jgi:hypothetical protein
MTSTLEAFTAVMCHRSRKQKQNPLVSEVTHAGQHHRDVVLVGGVDDFLVAHRTARMNHRGDAGRSRRIDAVAERKEGVGRHHRTGHDQAFVGGLDAGDLGGIDTAHLAGAYAYGLAILAVDDGVGFDEFRHFPDE